MSTPAISVILCTARPDHPYVEHPTWHVISSVAQDLARQTFSNFELIVVDGCQPRGFGAPTDMNITWTSPRDTIWTRNKKIAICAYRNTGLIHARGEFVVNLDDCCELGPRHLEFIWEAYREDKTCLAACGWDATDDRPQGNCTEWVSASGDKRPVPSIYGFNSFPLKAALDINGYDESYDGSFGLEDVDFNIRLHQWGVKLGTLKMPGFKLHKQCGYDPRAIDPKQPTVKCCNVAWRLRRDKQRSWVINEPSDWSENQISALMPKMCPMLLMSSSSPIMKCERCDAIGATDRCWCPRPNPPKCEYHKPKDVACAFAGAIGKDHIARGPRHPLYKELLRDPPIVSLRAEREFLHV